MFVRSRFPPTSRRVRRSVKRRGFTLIETALATIIIGVGVVAVVEAQVAFSQANQWSSHSATATMLANEIRQLTVNMPRHDPITGLYINSGTLVGWGREANETSVDDLDDIDDFSSTSFGSTGTFSGPIDATGNVIPEINSVGQVVTNAGTAVALEGWTQTVVVEKVRHFRFDEVLASGYFEPAVGTTPGTTVDGFPLRVTVTVTYQSPGSTTSVEVGRVRWIVPADRRYSEIPVTGP